MFDTNSKKAKIKSPFGERHSDVQWDRNDKSLLLVSNPLHWILSDEEMLKSIDPVDLYEKYNFDIYITMNGDHEIYAGCYKYYDVKISRIAFMTFPDKTSIEQRIKLIKAEESLTNEDKITLGLIPNNIEDKKKKEEYSKKLDHEDHVVQTIAKRPYSGLYLYGNFFPKSEHSRVNVRIFYLF